jgi:dephospho-CoA kinase
MFRAALTGNIASGKSAVAEIWSGLGATIVDADVLAREVVAPGSQGLERVVRTFGDGVLLPDGSLDRAALRRRIFADAASRRALEAILHPLIGQLRERKDEELARAGTHIVVHVIPLLFETGLDREFDAIVVVDAPESVRLQRLVQHRGMDAGEARRMIGAQMPAAAKRERATLVIENDSTLDVLAARAQSAWRTLEELAGRPA